MPYVNPNIYQIDWDDLTGWNDIGHASTVTEISPAGQLHLDCRAITLNSFAGLDKTLGAIGSGDYYVEIRIKGDVWDGYDAFSHGFFMAFSAETNRLQFFLGNGYTVGDGIVIYDGDSWNRVYAITWDNNWHTIVFFIHNGQTDADIWIDKDPATEAANVTDADCSYGTETEGYTFHRASGTVDGNGRYHIDYTYVGTGLAVTEYTITADVGAFTLIGIVALLIKGFTLVTAVGAFTLTGINILLTKALNLICAVGSFTLTGIAAAFIRALKMSVTVGTFTLTGINVILRKGWILATSVGTFTLTGITVALKIGYTLVATVGTFVLTLIGIGITKVFYTILEGLIPSKRVNYPSAKEKEYQKAKKVNYPSAKKII